MALGATARGCIAETWLAVQCLSHCHCSEHSLELLCILAAAVIAELPDCKMQPVPQATQVTLTEHLRSEIEGRISHLQDEILSTGARLAVHKYVHSVVLDHIQSERIGA